MSYVKVCPDLIAAGAADLVGIGGSVSSAHRSAVTPTTAIAPAAADDVSLAITRLFSEYGLDYQARAAHAERFLDGCLHTLANSGSSYSATELANSLGLVSQLLVYPRQLLLDFWQRVTYPAIALIPDVYALGNMAQQTLYSYLVFLWLLVQIFAAAVGAPIPVVR